MRAYNLNKDDTKSLSRYKVWIVDVDGCLYPRDKKECGICHGFKNGVAKAFNLAASNGDYKSRTAHINHIDFIKTIMEKRPEKLNHYLTIIYGDKYSRIKPDSNILEAFRSARDKGVAIYIYTNSPSAKNVGEMLHTQKVLRAHGFTEAELEFYKNQTYDLLMSAKSGFAKPSKKGMENFIRLYKINPTEAIMFDDDITNLKSAAHFGIKPVWTWTTDDDPEDHQKIKAQEILAIRIRNTGKALIKITK